MKPVLTDYLKKLLLKNFRNFDLIFESTTYNIANCDLRIDVDNINIRKTNPTVKLKITIIKDGHDLAYYECPELEIEDSVTVTDLQTSFQIKTT